MDDTKALRASARASRRDFAQSSMGRFERVMRAAMRDYLSVREQGVSREDAVKGIEAVLRDVWPIKGPRYCPVCDVCDDTGWRLRTCTHELRCARTRICHYAEPEWKHTYVVPCDCAAGDKFRAKLQTREDALVSIGRTKTKKKGWRSFTDA